VWTGVAAGLLLAVTLAAVYGWRPSVPGVDEAVELGILNETDRGVESRLSVFDSATLYRPFRAVRAFRDTTAAPEGFDRAEDSPSPHAVGLSLLARGAFAEAVPYLERALLESETPAVRNDLGVAFMEGAWENREEDESYNVQALTQFEIAQRLDPTFAPAGFNRVLWYERNERPDEARLAGEAYLEIDPDSGWAAEIRAIVEGGTF